MKKTKLLFIVGGIILVSFLNITAIRAQEVVLSENDLVKTPDSSALWLIQDGKKRVIPHSAVYHSWGYPVDFSTVKTVSDISAYPEAEAVPFRDGSLFRGTAESLYGREASAVFFVSDGKLRPIKSAKIYQKLFNDPDWQGVTWVPDDLLNKFEYPIEDAIDSANTHLDGSLVRYAGQSGVYLIQESKKRPIVSKKAFEDNHFKWENVIDINPIETYPNGPIIDKLEDVLIVPRAIIIIILPSGELPGTPVLADPGVSISAGKSFILDWSSVSNAIIYILERDTNPSFTSPIEIYGGTLSHYSEILSPTTDTTYYYRVQSKNNLGSSSWSNVVDMEVSAPGATVHSITITSPNGGEVWTPGQTYAITWESSGVDKIDLAVNYGKGFLGLGGPIPSVGVDAKIGKFYWQIDPNAPYIPGDNLKIRITDAKDLNIFDESDNYFSIIESVPPVTPPSPVEIDLVVKSLTKEKFHPYGFSMQVCINGPKSINDLKKENSELRDFPWAYEVIDTDGKRYYRYMGTVGTVELRKNGECEIFGWSIQLAEQPIFDRSGRIKAILDPNNLIREGNEDNNKFLYSSVTCLRDEDRKGVTCGGYFYEDYCELFPDGTSNAYIRKCNASCGISCGSLVSADRIFCAYGCQNGACIKEPLPPLPPVSCMDTDRGRNYYVKGSVSACEKGICVIPIPDGCLDEFILEEGYCENGKMLFQKYRCPNGCQNGVCACPDLDKRDLKSISLSSADVGSTYTVQEYYDSIDPGVNHNFEKAIQSGDQVIYTENGGSIVFRMNKYDNSSYAKHMFDIVSTSHTNKVVFKNTSIGEETFCLTSPDYYKINKKYYYIGGFWFDKIYVDVQTSIFEDSSDLAVEFLKKAYNKIVGLCELPISSSITVISPNGGEKWMIGETYEITWGKSGINQVVVDLYKNDVFFDSIVISSIEKISWKVQQKDPSNLPGDKYKIRISDRANPDIFDQSDNYFSIVKP